MPLADDLNDFRAQGCLQGQIPHPDANQVPGRAGDVAIHILAWVLVTQIDLAALADQPPPPKGIEIGKGEAQHGLTVWKGRRIDPPLDIKHQE